MMNECTVIEWFGKNVEDMTREELLDAFKNLARMHKDDNERHMSSMRLMRDMALLR